MKFPFPKEECSISQMASSEKNVIQLTVLGSRKCAEIGQIFAILMKIHIPAELDVK